MAIPDFYLAPSLVELRSEINEAYPKRDHSSDGWIGDPSHAARISDHNPDKVTHVVRAIDVDKDGIDPDLLVKKAIADFRTNYVIWNGHIWSREYKFKKRVYTGTNKHNHHVHISIRHGARYENSKASWGFAASIKAVASDQKANEYNVNLTKRIQVRLGLEADGIWGPGTDLTARIFRSMALAHAGAPRPTPGVFNVKTAQHILGVTEDGQWGPQTQKALVSNIRSMQTILDVSINGKWDVATDRKFIAARTNNLVH